MAMIAAMKNVLSPSSDTMMTTRVAMKPWMKDPGAASKNMSAAF